jgi:pSer/pThr/pTyr-binding forkhead associated (FHA) protein
MVWPPAPTFLRRPRTVSTTHDPDGGGNPRLIMAPSRTLRPGESRPVYLLAAQVTTIGSDPSCDIRLPGLTPKHAQVHHDERDEFVLVRTSAPGGTIVNGAAVDSAVLRTASRVQLGDHVLSFYREEYADHGRPHGGRLGGELGRQLPQPPRPGGTARPVSEWTSNDPRRSP